MKKLITLILMIGIICQGFSAFAKSGDVSGKIYATDIKAFINGVEVPSYNIGGKTAFIIEDVLEAYCYTYCDQYRTLIWSVPSPGCLISGSSHSDKKPGTAIGKTYETDIKTYMYDKLLPAFSLNGKMAVAIEDIAGDKVFSDIGARYFWDSENRTVSLEFIYDNSHELSLLCSEKHLNARVENGKITFSSDPFVYGSLSWEIPDGIGEVYCDDTYAGISFKTKAGYFLSEDDGNCVFKTDGSHTAIYFEMESLRAKLADITPVQPTREQWIQYYTEGGMSMFYTVKERLDTDDYTFMYLSFGGVMHGGTQCIIKISADGTCVDYANNFKSVSYGGGKLFDNARLDRDSRKFYFRYDKDYVLDLDSGELKNI